MASFVSASNIVCLAPNGKTLACIPSAGETVASLILRILLFQVETGTLQTTLTHRHKPLADDQATATTPPLKIFFAGSSSFLAILYAHRLLIWDLNRGVVAHTVSSAKATFLDACSAVNGREGEEDEQQALLFLMVSSSDTGKVQIHQYHVATGKLERKIKAGKGTVTALAATKDYFVVRYDDSLRVLDRVTGEKVSRCKSLTDGAFLACCDGSPALAATVSQGQIAWIDVKTGKQKSIRKIPAMDDKTKGFQVWQPAGGDKIQLLSGDKLCQIEQGTATLEKTWSCPLDGRVEQQWRVGHQNTLVGLLLKGGQYQVVTSAIPDSDEASIVLRWKDDAKKEEGDDARGKMSSTKRKEAPETSTVLGPTQAGGDALVSEGPSAKRFRIEKQLDDDGDDSENDGPTVGERLQLLQQALDDEEAEGDEDDAADNRMDTHQDTGFVPKQATTESLAKVLQQGLVSGEDQLLELAFSVDDAKILAQTCSGLPDDLLLQLLNAVTSRLASSHKSRSSDRTTLLCVWVSALLRTGRIRSLAHLHPLRNLIKNRIQVFPELLQLQGRLAQMTQSE